MRISRSLSIVLTIALVLGLAMPVMASQFEDTKSTWTVNNAGDEADINLNDNTCAASTGFCTLRAAIQTANDPDNIGSHTINFSANFEIALLNNLPTIVDDNMTITAVGRTVSITKPPSGNATSGLSIGADGCRIHNLTITGFTTGILINGSDNFIGVRGDGTNDDVEGNRIINNTSNGVSINTGLRNQIAGNLIGLDAAGNTQPNGSGVRVAAADSIIGTNGDGVGDGWEFNIISANTSLGIDVTSGGSGTKIAGNTIGLKSGAVVAAGNGMEGILVSGVNNVRIGTNGDGVGDGWEGNNIGANGLHGIRIDTGYGHKISGNLIGVGVNGVALGNGRSGIQLAASVYDSTIGTDESNPTYNTSERNIISGNLNSGIELQGYLVRVAGNYIGTDPGGTADRGNTQNGIIIEGHDNTIGTDGDGNADQYEYNVISGNNSHGILVAEATANNNIISGNIIGLNVSGTLALGNTFSGISLQNGPSGTHIGVGGTSTSDSYERNTISGNGSNGIWISSAQATTICGNYIGVDLTGLNDLGNSLYGIYIEPGNDTTITIGVPDGGRSSLGNVISGNNQSGIRIEDADNHIIAGNWIGTNVDVDDMIPNGQNGVHVLDASNTRIGMDGNGVTDALERNVITGNVQAGVFIDGATSQNNRISRNSFYANGTLAIDLAPAGLTANDGMDGDNGPNGLQNHPVVRTVFFPSAGQVRILGDFNSTPSSYFSVQFYASLQADPSGSGEGEIFLQEINLVTDASGTAYFDVLIPNLGSLYKYFSAIAIADNLNTSEFGPTVEAVTFPIYLPTILR